MSGPGAPDRPSALHVIRIHHVGIIVRNAEAAAETFQRGLGLDASRSKTIKARPAWRSSRPETRSWN